MKRKADGDVAMDEADTSSPPLTKHHSQMMEACASGNYAQVLSLLELAAADESSSASEGLGNQKHLLAAQQDPTTGLSPLMVAAQNGHVDICRKLLEAGAPWNALDRYGRCAGNLAQENEHWEVVNLLVDEGTKAELILGASIRLARLEMHNNSSSNSNSNSKPAAIATNEGNTNIPVSHEPCTKPDYLEHDNVRYNAANTLLLDNDNDAVMMEWERPLMNAHANILVNGTKRKRVMNIGFGLGIIDTALQGYEPALHVIIEAHPTVYKKMLDDGWDKKENVRICFGRWQDELPKLIEEGVQFDGIFYDTYGEHFTDLEDFHGEFLYIIMLVCIS
jgi:protein arginine N-methyltransferase 2